MNVDRRLGDAGLDQTQSEPQDDVRFGMSMQEMAADPQIQAECEAIARDFSACELDGLPEE